MALVMTPIYTQTASGSATGIQFNNIPQIYTDLMVLVSARSNNSTNDSLFMQAGTTSGLDTSAVYSQTRLAGDGASSFSDRQTSQTYAFVYGTVPATNGTANTFGNAEIYIPNYLSGNFKSFIFNGVSERNGTSGNNIEQMLHADLWRNSAMLTTLRFQLLSSSTFAANSTFSLYGIIRQGA